MTSKFNIIVLGSKQPCSPHYRMRYTLEHPQPWVTRGPLQYVTLLGTFIKKCQIQNFGAENVRQDTVCKHKSSEQKREDVKYAICSQIRESAHHYRLHCQRECSPKGVWWCPSTKHLVLPYRSDPKVHRQYCFTDEFTGLHLAAIQSMTLTYPWYLVK